MNYKFFIFKYNRSFLYDFFLFILTLGFIYE